MGLYGWLLQRFSAIILALYFISLIGYLFFTSPHDYQSWQLLFENNFMRIASLLALFALSIHAFIGLWIIIGDYIKPKNIRFFLNVASFIISLSYIFFGGYILWS